jgi:GMP synthase (glutamine-hydrolysing)
MKIHCLQHVPFEGLASIEIWAKSNDHFLSATRFYQGELLPEIEDIDWLVVMGGPMNIYEENKYPWLVKEKKLLSKRLNMRKLF